MERINLEGIVRNFQQNFTTAYSKIVQKGDWVCARKLNGNNEEAYVKLCLLNMKD